MENKQVRDAAELLREMQIEGKGGEQFIDIVDGNQIKQLQECCIGEGLDEDEDFEFAVVGGDNADNEFDGIVGTLQEILLDENFSQLQKKFCDENCMHFEATEENKLIYTDIFKKYNETIEAYISQKLAQAIEGFDMEKFLEMVEQRKDEIDEQIMDLLLSFVDFESFKELMLFSRAHLVATTPKLKSGKAAALGLKDGKQGVKAQPKSVQEGKQAKAKYQEEDIKHYEECIDKLAISGYQTVMHVDEQEEGEEMPDLMLDIKKV